MTPRPRRYWQSPLTLAAASAASLALSLLAPRAAAADLALDEAVNRALASSPKVKAAEADLQAATEAKHASFADIGPRVSADYNELHFDSEQSAVFAGNKIILRPKVTKTGSLTATQPITGAFALDERARQNRVVEDLKDLALRQAKLDTAFGAAEAWLRAAEKSRLVVVADESVNAADRQRIDASALERAGRLNHGDQLKLELAVSEAKARAAGARAAQEIAYAQLRAAVGLAANEPVTLPDATGNVKVDPAPRAPVDVQQVLDKRLETRQATLAVASSSYGKKLVYAAMTPSLNVFAKWDRNMGDLEPGIGGKPSRDTRTLGITANWLLWDNGSRIFQLRQAAEGVSQAEYQKEQILQGVRLDIAATESQLKAAKESLILAETAVQQAEEAYRIEQARFKTGTRSATDLILAEASRSGAQGRLVSARTDYRVLSLKMQKAVGEERPATN